MCVCVCVCVQVYLCVCVRAHWSVIGFLTVNTSYYKIHFTLLYFE